MQGPWPAGSSTSLRLSLPNRRMRAAYLPGTAVRRNVRSGRGRPPAASGRRRRGPRSPDTCSTGQCPRSWCAVIRETPYGFALRRRAGVRPMMLMRLAQLRLSWLRAVRRPLARRVLPPGDRFSVVQAVASGERGAWADRHRGSAATRRGSGTSWRRMWPMVVRATSMVASHAPIA